MAPRQRLHAVNALQRLNQELCPRTKVVVCSRTRPPGPRLVSALAMETSDERAAGKTYLTFAD
jgi:hypothetical protein